MNATVDAIFGPSQAMRTVLEQVRHAAATHGHILISGEPGTGREMVAREIHKRSVQGEGGFVKVAYTWHSPEALELDLFGFHSSGRGDGQEPSPLERIARGGQLHQALGGTLFFEHLPELPSRVQARLARLFRDGEAIVVHERDAVNFNARAIAAVERSYDDAVSEGRVRSDLHRVISTLRIELPPLRNRREDIPALTDFFLASLCRRASVPVKAVSEPARQLLSALPWHGNALELKSLLENMVLRVRRDVIGLEDVLATVQLDGRARPFGMLGTLREARARFERDYIAAMLEQHHGRVPDAAQALGIQRTNLYRKLRRLKVPQRRARETDHGPGAQKDTQKRWDA